MLKNLDRLMERATARSVGHAGRSMRQRHQGLGGEIWWIKAAGGLGVSDRSEKDMNKTMYEVNWHSVNDVFSHCTVTPITVLREGVLPGCTGVSITAKDSEGRTFQGSPDNYYTTEEAAWSAARVELAESVEAHEKQLAELQEQLDAQRSYLANLTPNDDVTGLAPRKD